MEFLHDYEYEIGYHPGKAIVVADTLSLKERVKTRRVKALSMTIQSSLIPQILNAQLEVLAKETSRQKASGEWKSN